MTDIAEFDLDHAGARVAGHGWDAWIAETRELLKLSGPLILTQLAQMAIGTTDAIMLAHYSNSALAGAVLGNTMFYFCWLLGSGPTAAVSPMIAHILGATPTDRRNVRAVVQMGFWSVLMVGPPLLLMLWFAKPILMSLGQSDSLATKAAAFVVPLSFGLPFSLGFQVLRNYSTALSKPNASLIVMTISVFFNAAFDYALIFGHFGFPKMGLTGSGIASACSFALSFLLMLLVVRLTPTLHLYRIFQGFRTLDWEKLREIYRLGLPIGLTMMFEATLFFSSNFFMGHFGLDYLAAHSVAMNIPSVTFMVPLGIAMASTVRVGLAAGAGDREAARRAGYAAMLVATGFMSITAVILWIWPFEIASLYLPATAANMASLQLAVVLLHVAAAFQIFDGIQVAAALSLRGLKDARAPMWIAGASYWLAGFPTCVLFAFHFQLEAFGMSIPIGFGLKGLGIWIGLLFGLAVAAVLMCLRFWYLSRDR